MNKTTYTQKALAYMLALTVAIFAAFSTTGCITAGDRAESDMQYMLWRTAQKTAVQYAVLQYAGNDAAKSARVQELTRFAINQIDKDATALLDELVAEVKAQIDWSKVSADEQLIILAVIDTARIAMQRSLERNEWGELTASELAAVNRMDIRSVLNWIHEATLLHAVGARAE